MRPLLEALDKAVNIAKERRLDDTSRWEDVIKAVTDLLPKEDMEKFKGFCNWEKYGFDESDGDLVDDLKRILAPAKKTKGTKIPITYARNGSRTSMTKMPAMGIAPEKCGRHTRIG